MSSAPKRDNVVVADIASQGDVTPEKITDANFPPSGLNFNPEIEPLLQDNPKRFVIFPLQCKDIWTKYKEAEVTFWTAEEIPVNKDKDDWATLPVEERNCVNYILAYFVSPDGVLNKNLVENFSKDIQVTEARCFYGFQIAMENIHLETYGILLHTFVDESEELVRIFKSIRDMACVTKKRSLISEWFDGEGTDFGQKVAAFAAIQTILFSGGAAVILSMKKRALLTGLTLATELILRDRILHRNFACTVFSYLVQRPSEEFVVGAVREVVSIECQFLSEIVPASFAELNVAEACTYVEYLADKLLVDLSCVPVYGAANPFGFMADGSLMTDVDYFSKKPGDIKVSAIPEEQSTDDFAMDANF